MSLYPLFSCHAVVFQFSMPNFALFAAIKGIPLVTDNDNTTVNKPETAREHATASLPVAKPTASKHRRTLIQTRTLKRLLLGTVAASKDCLHVGLPDT